MKRSIIVLFSLAVIASMLLGACSPAATPTTSPATEPPAASQPTDVPVVAPGNEATSQPEASGQPTEPPQPPASDRLGGWLDSVVFSAVAEIGPAVEQLEAGAIDMYPVASEDDAVYEKVRNSQDLAYANSYGGMNQLLFNPATCANKDVLNPFSNMKIREAMNWAIDRKYISEDIMGGLAIPKFTPFTSAFADYSRYSDLFSAIETKYAFDLQKAKDVVEAEMPAMGATKGADGKWMYNGKPVTILGLIRTEDKRKEIGNYFANQLETLGFTVDRQEKDRNESGPIWQDTDPVDCKFMYYTAGWGSQVVARDDANMFVQYNTGIMQTMPVFYAYQPSAELLDAAKKLYTSDFTTMDERRKLFEIALPLSMQESWWGVWVTDNISYSPFRKGTEGAYDLASGFSSSQLYPYTVRFTGQEGGEMKLAQSNLLVEPWNPIAGSNWTDDGTVQHFAEDWGTVYNPYTGLYIPKLVEKANLVAQEGLPITTSSDWITLDFQKEIPVPEDAWVDWDAANQKFITAAEKYTTTVTAKVKSVVTYRPELWQTTWHDGSNMSVADFVMNMITTFDLGKPESKVYDESLAPGVETFLSHFKGLKIISTDPLVIETYEDQYTMDAENSIVTWYPAQYLPSTGTLGMLAWHDITPALMAEANKEIGLTDYKALQQKTDQTSLISGPTLDIQVKYLDQALAEQYIPYAPTLSQYVTPEEATARYQNLKQWYESHKHLFIGTGPYYVDKVYPVEKTITLNRYDKYIFPASEWSSFSEPKLATVEVEGPLSVKVGEEATFDVSVFFKDQPYPATEIEKATYSLLDAQNQVIASGDLENLADGQYQAVLSSDVTSKLETGGAKLAVAVSSKLVSMPAVTSYQFVVTK